MTYIKSRIIITLIAVALAVIILNVATAVGQTRADLGGTVSGSQNLGNSGPSFGIAAHVVTRKNRLGGEFNVGYLRSPKNQVDAGHGRQLNGSAAVRFYARSKWFASGLVTGGQQRTDLYSKAGGGIGGGGGYDDGTNTLQAHYSHWFDREKQRQVGVNYERVLRFSERGFVSVRPFVLTSRFGTPFALDGVNRRLNGVRGGITVGVGRLSK